MATKFARRVDDIEGSSIFRINEQAQALEQQGRDVLRLDAGEPDFPTPVHIRNAAHQAIEEGYTRYTPVAGLPALRDAIVEKFARDNHLSYTPDEVMATGGAKQALFNLCMSVLHPGDEVVIPSPHWGSYGAMATMAWATAVDLPAGIEDGFLPDPAALESVLNRKTRLIVLNSPNNPSGQVFDKATLQAVGKVLEGYPDVFIVTDDIYEHLRWDGDRYYNIVNACPSLKRRTVVVNGVSKAYAMTGWRLGFCAGPVDVISEMTTLQGQSTSHPDAIAQMAAAAALAGDQGCVAEMRDRYQAREALVSEALASLPGVDCLPARGSFYCLPDFRAVIADLLDVENDEDLADWLLQEAGIAMVPGSAFGAPGHLRLSFAASEHDLERAMDRLAELKVFR